MSIVDVEISAKEESTKPCINFHHKPNLNFQHNRKQAKYFSSQCSGKHAGLWNINISMLRKLLTLLNRQPIVFQNLHNSDNRGNCCFF
jgi:hypothetical protein